MELDTRHMNWLETRGISVELASKLGIGSKPEGGKLWLSVPYVERGRVVNHKRRLASDKDSQLLDKGAPLVLWNHDVLLDDSLAGQPLIITEGEWDALAALTCGKRRVVSVPNGAPGKETTDLENAARYAWFWRSRDLLDKVERVILAVDNDEAGRALGADLARLFGPERCLFLSYPDGCKDLNDVLMHHGSSAVIDIIDSARSYPVKGLYRFSDFPDPPPVQYKHINMAGMDDHFLFVPGTFTVIAGYASAGKTSLFCTIMAKLLRKGVSIAVASFETQAKPIFQRMMRAALLGVSPDSPEANRPSKVDFTLENQFQIIGHNYDNEDQEFNIEELIETARLAVLRDGASLIVIDPWNELEHRRNRDESETEYAGRAIRALKRFAKFYNVAVWLVAHPRKPHTDGGPKQSPSLYDIAGSAHFANKADYGMIVYRDDLASTVVNVSVVKVRMGLPGRVGKLQLNYDPSTSDYEHIPQFGAAQ